MSKYLHDIIYTNNIKGDGSMTLEELKKLDRNICEIPYPFGNNFPLICQKISEAAKRLGRPESDIIRQYADWKFGQK